MRKDELRLSFLLFEEVMQEQTKSAGPVLRGGGTCAALSRTGRSCAGQIEEILYYYYGVNAM